jgi:hypothetical protein
MLPVGYLPGTHPKSEGKTEVGHFGEQNVHNCRCFILKMPPEKNLRGFYIQHWKNFVVCGGHLISINLPPRNWEGYYAYSSRMRGKSCLL